MTAPAGTSSAQLGGYTFRLNPSQVFFSYNMDTRVIPTIGGRVVQVYGCTLGDMTIQGHLGVDRTTPRESWQLAEDFQAAIAGMVQAQSTPPSAAQLNGTDLTPMHQPVRFLYNDDTPDRRAAGLPLHNWDFMVYVKSLKDIKSDYTIVHETGKFYYEYTLTLFIVEDNTGTLAQNITDDFITSLADGIGWAQSTFNGPMTTTDVSTYLQQNSPDGTIHGLVLKELAQSSLAFNNITAQTGTGVPITGSGTAPGATTGGGLAGGPGGVLDQPGAVSGPTPGGSAAPNLSSITPQNDPNYAADVANAIRQQGGAP